MNTFETEDGAHYRYDLCYFNGPRIALVRMDTADQRFSTNATLLSYVVMPQQTQQFSR